MSRISTTDLRLHDIRLRLLTIFRTMNFPRFGFEVLKYCIEYCINKDMYSICTMYKITVIIFFIFIDYLNEVTGVWMLCVRLIVNRRLGNWATKSHLSISQVDFKVRSSRPFSSRTELYFLFSRVLKGSERMYQILLGNVRPKGSTCERSI